MVEQNELSEFEKQLNELIEMRNNFVPEYEDINAPSKPKNGSKPRVWTEQEMKRLHEMGNLGMFMGIREHGQPFRREDEVSFMMVHEHGQPFRREDEVSLMMVHEHGRPMFATRMAVGEHGQPYRRRRFVDKK